MPWTKRQGQYHVWQQCHAWQLVLLASAFWKLSIAQRNILIERALLDWTAIRYRVLWHAQKAQSPIPVG